VIVVDASLLVDLLLHRRARNGGSSVSDAVAGRPMAAPHLIDAEVGHALRRAVLRGSLTAATASAALEDLGLVELERYPHTALLPRAFALRDNATIYDALYLALAESLRSTLLTRDRALAQVPRVHALVEVVG
jgi:predicted nucleic acid-binding protein